MKKFLLILSTMAFFGISSEIFAQDITRYSEYSENWTLDKQLFDLSDDPFLTDVEKYKKLKFKVSTCLGADTLGDVAEYGDNFNGLGRLEIIGNKLTEVAFWKFKPGKEFVDLENEDFIEFCYFVEGNIVNNDPNDDYKNVGKIKIKRSKKQLTLRSIGTGDQKKVVISKKIGDIGTDIEVSLRCEPDDIAFSNINTGEQEEKFVLSITKLNLKTENDDFRLKIEGNELENISDNSNTFFSVKSESINANFYFSSEGLDSGVADGNEENGSLTSFISNKSKVADYVGKYPDYLEMALYEGKIEKQSDVLDFENHKLVSKGNGISLSTNLEIGTGTKEYSLVTKIKGSSASESIKIYSLSRDLLSVYSTDFKVDIEGTSLENQTDLDKTFFSIESDFVNMNFKFSPENRDALSDGEYILSNPEILELSLYEGKISDITNIPGNSLSPIAKSNGTNLSVNIENVSQNGNIYTLIARINGLDSGAVLKTYSISRYGAKIISSDVFPSIAKSGSSVHFDIIANIYNSLSDLDYAQIVFDDDRFEKMNLIFEDTVLTGSGDVLGKELAFSGDYTLPSDSNLDGQFIGYNVYVILKDGTRTKIEGKKEIYVGTRADICKDSKMCVLRGLKALKNKNKTSFEKVLIENFDENEYDFTENDLYKIFRKK